MYHFVSFGDQQRHIFSGIVVRTPCSIIANSDSRTRCVSLRLVTGPCISCQCSGPHPQCEPSVEDSHIIHLSLSVHTLYHPIIHRYTLCWSIHLSVGFQSRHLLLLELFLQKLRYFLHREWLLKDKLLQVLRFPMGSVLMEVVLGTAGATASVSQPISMPKHHLRAKQ